MLEVMKLTCLLHTLTTAEYRRWPEPKEVLRWATAGGYEGVNMAGKAGVIKARARPLLRFATVRDAHAWMGGLTARPLGATWVASRLPAMRTPEWAAKP